MLVLSSGRRRLLDLDRAFSCVTEQLCPESRAAGAPSLPGSTCCQVQAEQLHAIPTAATPAGPRQPEQLFGLSKNPLGGNPKPNNHSVWQPDQAGQQPEKRTMAGFCGFGGSPKPDEPGTEPDPEALGKPEPESPRHPRK